MERKEILPKWIRFFSWIHLFMFMAPLVFFLGLTGVASVSFTMFGLEYSGTTSLDPIAAWITIVGTLSAFVAYGILWGKNWAVVVGIFYGWLGLATSVAAVVIRHNSGEVYIPLEPLLLIPFIIILSKRKKDWEDFCERVEEGDYSNRTGEAIATSDDVSL